MLYKKLYPKKDEIIDLVEYEYIKEQILNLDLYSIKNSTSEKELINALSPSLFNFLENVFQQQLKQEAF